VKPWVIHKPIEVEPVRIAIFADIHANREAFAACLADAHQRGATPAILLGDYVGYGADPNWTVMTVMGLVDNGAVAVRGNHDDALGNPRDTMNAQAQASIEWTREELGTHERQFLEKLPLIATDDDRLYVHSDASCPSAWHYVVSAHDAWRSIEATSARVTFCGHVHQPQLYAIGATGRIGAFRPIADAAIPLSADRRWLAVIGSVGQPRDGNPAASYAVLDTNRHQLTYVRVPYDVAAAAAKIRNNGLPAWLADRLSLGK
jgi:diadenosine tetraphosphatase ApaH/serine/threonine PP2A family protein phosphatase